ncbi:MAG: hypothetical protein AB2693_31300 [Candidatus Thiodiazotropha sp.]
MQPEQSGSAGSINIQSLTAQITQSVTVAVIQNLRQAGLLSETNGQAATPPSVIQNEDITATSSTLPGTSQTMQGADTSATNVNSSPSTPSGNKTGRYVSSRMPLHALISQKKKEKIWAGEYIDLSTLQEDDVEDITFNIRTGAFSSSVAPRKKFMSIEKWTDAFNIFSSVRRLRFPAEADGLAAYMNLIRRIANERGSWYFYDTNFRKMKQTEDRAWDEIENELFLIALNRKQQPFRHSRESDTASQSVSRRSNFRSCNKYNKGIQCSGCSFPHICRDCGKPNHPQFKCWSKPTNKTSYSQGAPSDPKPNSTSTFTSKSQSKSAKTSSA